MAIIDSLKKGSLFPGVFITKKAGPKPAKIYFKIPYSEQFQYLVSVKGFRVSLPTVSNNPEGYIQFQLPVTPPTIEIDTGNTKDTEQVARVGEVVLAKYKKAIQVRWESFFPYDLSAPYLNSNVRSTFSDLRSMAVNAVSSIRETLDSFRYGSVICRDAVPDDYIQIFLYLAKTEKPFEVSMTYYEGGHLKSRKYTLDSFKTEPESNGDYKYNLSIIEWTDIKPKQLNIQGQQLPNDNLPVSDKVVNKTIQGISNFWSFCKASYGVISKTLMMSVLIYNKVLNFAITTELSTWKIKGAFKKYSSRLSFRTNMIGKSKIDRSDTRKIAEILKNADYSKSSEQLAELLKSRMS